MPEWKLLFITHIEPNRTASGSSVRPLMLQQAFREIGCDVHTIYGPSNRLATRMKVIRETFRWLKDHRPDFCYVEPPSGPMFCLCDHLLLLHLKRQGVPMGVFVRDAFWKVPDTWGQITPKRLILEIMSRFDWLIYQMTMKVLYFPSQRMSSLFRSRLRKIVLPPGGMDLTETRDSEHSGDPISLIYVGAIADRYGTDLLFDAFRIVATARPDIRLHVVCRRDEWQKMSDSNKNLNHVDFHHIQGRELNDLYRRCDVALIPIRKSRYMDFAMPIKLFEYLSFNIPLVVTDCAEISEFVGRYHLGLVTASDAAAFAAGILQIVSDPTLIGQYRQAAAKALHDGHLWTDRARQIVKDLGGK